VSKPKYCWVCGVKFNEFESPYHETCQTYVCPQGHCFCSLSPEAQRAVEYAMVSYGLWHLNPRRRKKKRPRIGTFKFTREGFLSWVKEHFPELHGRYTAGIITFDELVTEMEIKMRRTIIIG